MAQGKVGFIGVGLMGHGMAKNIVEKGFELVVLRHRKAEAVEDLKTRGATEATSLRDMAEQCDRIVLCVTGTPQVEALVLGADGLASAGRPLLLIDCSTSEPESTRQLAARLAPQNIRIVDAPLSRSPKEAWEGTLDVMAGGAPADLAEALPLLNCFARRVVETGEVGTGHTLKLLNNSVSLGYAAIYAEALMLGAKSGITPEIIHKVLAGGRMDCPFFQTFFDYVVGGNPEAHRFTMRNALKDMTYMSNVAGALSAANPVGSAVRNSLALAVGRGDGERYLPHLAASIAEANGVSLPGT